MTGYDPAKQSGAGGKARVVGDDTLTTRVSLKPVGRAAVIQGLCYSGAKPGQTQTIIRPIGCFGISNEQRASVSVNVISYWSYILLCQTAAPTQDPHHPGPASAAFRLFLAEPGSKVSIPRPAVRIPGLPVSIGETKYRYRLSR
jgi:hypothetical protein